jgi:hypothetical protein
LGNDSGSGAVGSGTERTSRPRGPGSVATIDWTAHGVTWNRFRSVSNTSSSSIHGGLIDISGSSGSSISARLGTRSPHGPVREGTVDRWTQRGILDRARSSSWVARIGDTSLGQRSTVDGSEDTSTSSRVQSLVASWEITFVWRWTSGLNCFEGRNTSFGVITSVVGETQVKGTVDRG